MNKLYSILEDQAPAAQNILGSADALSQVINTAKATAKNPKLLSILSKGPMLLKYLTSPQAPIAKRIEIAAALLYLVSPISLPGPIDEILVLTWLVPFLNKELEDFAAGSYQGTETDSVAVSRTGNPLFALFATEDGEAITAPEKSPNPLRNL